MESSQLSTVNSQLPDGYKQTDVGIIPEDWDVDKIVNQTSITTGAKNTQDKIDEGIYPFFVRSQTVERINSYSFDGEAVLTAGDGVGTGKIYHYINGKFDFHQRVYKISNFSKELGGYFFFVYFSNNFYNRIMQMTAKSSVDSVRREMIANMQIPLPPLPEQQAITEVLSDVDALVTSLDRLIAKKRDIKQGAMQLLLTGKKRLVAESKRGYKQTDVGVIPEDWEVVKVGKITGFHKQGYYTQETYKDDSKYFLLRGTDMLNPKVNLSTTPKINSNANDFRSYKVEKGDVLIVRSGSIGRYGIVEDIPESMFGSYLINFRFDQQKLLNSFFGYFYESYETQNQILKIIQGSSNININAENIKSLKIPLPPLSEQKAIARILSGMDAEIEALEKKRDKYKAIKQGMMQELLTGKTRLV